MTRALPQIMVAPNGARRGKSDHPELPITLDEMVATGSACKAAGAGGIHLHVRDGEGNHSLDVGLYRELLSAMEKALPGFFLQVTSEAAGRFGPEAQMQMIRQLRPRSVSLAFSELMRAPTEKSTAREFYAWAQGEGVGIHHIAYTPKELATLFACIDDGIIAGTDHQLQLVLGSYAQTEPSHPSDLDAYLSLIEPRKADLSLDWMICAFGPTETDCLVHTALQGGKVRVGFENSLWNADGTLARDNAQRVAEVHAAISAATSAGNK